MRFLTRLVKPYLATRAYEWAESCDLLLGRRLGKDHSWDEPFERPQRADLSIFDRCFDDRRAQSAIDLLAVYRDEIDSLPPALSLNGFFGPADVAFYWAFIRTRRPKLIIEIGSGYSSRVALRALARNRDGRLICIDPAPRLHLPENRLTHIASKIEDVDAKLFDEFQPHDILFIDSSHTGAEVQKHAALLDRLPVGALVHYHDIDYPWDRQYPEWNEDEVVAAFLEARPNWNVLVSGSILSRDYMPQLRAAIPSYRRSPYRRYNGLWIKRMG